MARINFARFTFKFPAYFWDIVSRQYAVFTFKFPAYFYEDISPDPPGPDPAQVAVFTFTFPATFYEVPI